MKHASLADTDRRRQIRLKCLHMLWFTSGMFHISRLVCDKMNSFYEETNSLNTPGRKGEEEEEAVYLLNQQLFICFLCWKVTQPHRGSGVKAARLPWSVEQIELKLVETFCFSSRLMQSQCLVCLWPKGVSCTNECVSDNKVG